MSTNLSRHAQSRVQQRCIPPLIIEWLLDFGAEERTHGASRRYFDKASRKKLAREKGQEVVKLLAPLLDTYLVHTDDLVVTVGHRTRRFRGN